MLMRDMFALAKFLVQTPGVQVYLTPLSKFTASKFCPYIQCENLSSNDGTVGWSKKFDYALVRFDTIDERERHETERQTELS